MTNPPARKIALEACFNFRDVGGYRTDEGRTVRWGRYYRSGRPDGMTDEDRARVARLGIATQLDLRNRAELESQQPGDLGSGAVRHWLSLLPDGASAELNQRFGKGMSGERYVGYLTFDPEPWRTAFELLADPASYPLLVHCVAGKDRTGVLTALTLSVLGVPRSVIEADYEVTNEEVSRLVAYVESKRGLPEGMTSEDLATAYSVPPGAMGAFLEGLDREHGGACGYLRSIGIGASQLERIRSNLLEPDGA